MPTNSKEKKMKATIQGGWKILFEVGHWCGKANDSLSISADIYMSKMDKEGETRRHNLGVLTRKDVKRLRDLCDEVLNRRARINPLSKF